MKTFSASSDRQSGFTLVELAIVLVIIGLILAAVLKGQEMILNAKVKNVVNDLRGVSTAYFAYQDRYKAIPGDDASPSTHLGQVGFIGGGEGTITGKYNDNASTVATESQAFWQHTRLAGFTTGTATAGLSGAGTAPAATNALGGLLGVEGGTANVFGMVGNAVCVGSIPWKIAQSIDIIMDDGNGSTGIVRAGATSATANADTAATAPATPVYGPGASAPASTDQLHTLCMKI